MLHKSGVNIWYDDGIEFGQEWRAEIAQALDGATTLLFYHSNASTTSKHCIREISYALDAEISILRIDLDGSLLPPTLRLGLQPEQAIDPKLYSKQDYVAKLLQAFDLLSEHERVDRASDARGVYWWRYAPVAFGLVVACSSLVWVLSESDPSGGGVQNLALVLSDTEPIVSPQISPDGSLPDVYVMPSLGGNALPVIRGSASASWSYDGNRIVYAVVDEPGGSGIGIADRDGGNAQNVYKHSGEYRPYAPR